MFMSSNCDLFAVFISLATAGHESYNSNITSDEKQWERLETQCLLVVICEINIKVTEQF